MDEIKKLLHDSGLVSLKESGLTVVSLYGVSEEKKRTRSSATTATTALSIANTVVGNKQFTFPDEPLAENTTLLVEGLQMYVDHDSKTVYLFMDSNLDIMTLTKEKSFSASMMSHQSLCMRGLLFMLTVSHLVIPILPPSILPAEFMSTLVALNQVKSNMYTHLVQYQSSCWKHWDINVPNALFEKKELERGNPNLMGWWGPAKGVPMLVFIAINIQFPSIVPIAIKRMQERLQVKTKNIFRALHLIPLTAEGNAPNPPVEVRYLFLLPSGSQPIIHIVPTCSNESALETKKPAFTFGAPMSLSDYLQNNKKATESPSGEYGNKLLRNFVSIWMKNAVHRHPLHSNLSTGSNNRKGDSKSVPLPNGMQFISAIVPLISFIFGQTITEDGVDFRKVMAQDFPSTKGMVQQIDVILRKKIKDNVEIERVFSKNHSMNLMEKCSEAYLQDSPPFYTKQYHTWKKNNVMRMYQNLARGPCMEEYAARLERECDNIWKQGRQSCEHVSLTGKACRLKVGHENDAPPQKSARDDRSIPIDTSKHNSGFNFFHGCNCGSTQKVREDPFDIEEANIKFYNKFNCCMSIDRAALDIKKSTFGESQKLVFNVDEVPPDDSALLYLGPSSMYKNNVGLDKVEGFMSNTNFLIPWSITTVNELKLRQQEAAAAAAAASVQAVETSTTSKTTSESATKNSLLSTPTAGSSNKLKDDTTEWPMLGKHVAPKPAPVNTPAPIVASLEAFPALGANPVQPTTSTPAVVHQPAVVNTSTNPSGSRQLFDTRRKRHHRARDRIQGLIRGYVGAEYECPHGHRFLSCGEGRVCKLGHAGHPKEHGNYFVHQDLPIFVICPCTYANNATSTNNLEVTAQLQRLYVVTPDEALTLSIEPKVEINIPGKEGTIVLDLGMEDGLSFGPNGVYILRLPFIYRDTEGLPIPVEVDVQKRLKSATLLKDCIKFNYKVPEKWEIAV